MSSDGLKQIKRLMNSLSEDHLREVSDLAVQKLRQRYRAKQQRLMVKFNKGDKVHFMHRSEKIVGTIVKFNQKSVTLCTHDGHEWNVAPSLLTRTSVTP